MKKIWLVVFCLSAFSIAKSQSLPAPFRLRCDLLLNAGQVNNAGVPTKFALEDLAIANGKFETASIISSSPVFYWETDTLIKKQTAYRILVASNKKLLEQGQADIWDSNKEISNSSNITYPAKPLRKGTVYFWKVQCWDQKDKPTAFSKISSFIISEPEQGEQFSHYSLAASFQQAEKIVQKNNGSWFLDFGKDGFAQIHLLLNSSVSDSIWIEVAEALQSPNTVLVSNGNIRYSKQGLFVQKGTHDYIIQWPANAKRNSRNPVQMPEYIGEVFPFRYVVISNFKGKIEKNSVTRKMIHYPFDDNASSFVSYDTVLNKVWDLCKYSIKATSFSGYYVDGDRERLPYEADALINQLSHYAVDAEFSMARRSMAFLLFHPTWPTEWSLQNVLLAWNDYMYTGDDAYLKKYYSELQKKILIPLAGKNGLISTTAKKQEDDFLESIHMMKDFDGKHGLKDNVDWPQRGDYIGDEKEYKGETDGFVYTNYNSVINAYYYQCLLLMQKIAKVLGKEGDASMYLERSIQVYNSFQSTFMDPNTGLVKDGDTTLHSSLHANMFALCFGLVPNDKMGKVVSFIKTRKMACSVYGAQFLLEALYDVGEDKYALELMNSTKQRSWYNMIRVGSTISMEAWDKIYKPNLDLNHAWGSAPANIIVRKLMGVEPLSPGGDQIKIQPRLGELSFAKLTTTTLKGKVQVSGERSNARNRYEVLIPGSVSATVILPADLSKTILFMDGKKMNTTITNGQYQFNHVTSGKHTWVMQ